MRRKVILKQVISVVKLSLFPTWCWPLPKDTTKFKMSCMKLYHLWCIITAAGLGAALLYSISNHFNEPAILVQLILISMASVHIIINFIFYHINYHRIQVINIYLKIQMQISYRITFYNYVLYQ